MQITRDVATMKHVAFIPLLIAIAVAATATNTLRVDFKNGNNIAECWTGAVACQTLDYAANGVKDHTVIEILSDHIQEIPRVANFYDLVDISIVSFNRSSLAAVVQCDDGAGLKFIKVSNLTIINVNFTYCGSVQDSSSASYDDSNITFGMISAIYLLNCTNVSLESITCSHGPGSGVAMYDVSGSVRIENSTFGYNNFSQTPVYPGGSGVYIEHTSCSVGNPHYCGDDVAHNPLTSNNQYRITGCLFVDNVAETISPNAVTFADSKGPRVQRLGWGGGLMIALMGSASRNNFVVENCTFKGNSAPIGGGIAFQMTEAASYNNITVNSSQLMENTAHQGGGGIHFGYIFYNNTHINSNAYNFHNVKYHSNRALYGGGSAVYSTRALESNPGTTQISFRSCCWEGNRADVGAAVALYPDDWSLINDGYLPNPYFDDCDFIGNSATSSDGEDLLGIGILFSNEFSIYLNTSRFHDNHGSGIYITAGRIHILPLGFVGFWRNHADRGAGISLMGYAGITAYKHSAIVFQENHAMKYGGAIYYGTIDKLDYVNSRRCFIRYERVLPPDQWETLFDFVNNTAGDRGHSIYASSLLPCARASFNSSDGKINPYKVFRWEKQFIYDPKYRPMEISTDASNISLQEIDHAAFPGLRFSLPLIIKDELNNTVSTVFETSKNNASSKTCDIPTAFEYVSGNVVQINGMQGSWINYTLRTVSDRQVGITVLSNLDQCPPGYVLDPNELSCVCSASTGTPYDGIVACNETTNQGVLKNGYWAGCSKVDNKIHLLTAPCPLGYCANPNTSSGSYLLSSKCEGLEEQLCGPQNRSGNLCGNCDNNLTVYYHSNRFLCASCPQPGLGILFYIVSELLPLTILFITVILFGVSLTSGAANSFIFFAQVLDLFEITAFGGIHFPYTIEILTDVYRFLFGFLNLDFFRIDILSFCLFKGATVLDILAFKYVTALYGILLIVVLALFMHYCSCLPKRDEQNRARLKLRAMCRYIHRSGHAIIHGITAFFIITYSQLCKVSFQILTKTTLRTDRFEPIQDVVFLSGETKFFSLEHLKYAIPAVIVLLYAILVPLVLISHPLYYLCKKVRSRHQNDMANSVIFWDKRCCFPSSRELNLLLKPFFDAFQSCFKDSMRFFGGLYFIYRLVIAACMAFSHSAIEMYGWLEISLIVMLTIHAICQPYEKPFFNILDSLILSCLAIINGISLFNYADTLYIYQNKDGHFLTTATVQMILIYAPLLYMIIYVMLKVLCWYSPIRNRLQQLNEYIPLFDTREQEDYDRINEDVEDGRFDDDILPARMFEREQRPNSDIEREVLLHEAPLPERPRQRATCPGAIYGATTNNV